MNICPNSFQGCYNGNAADKIALSMAHLCNISERRIAQLIDPNNNRGLPSMLVKDCGLNSGFMIPQYTASAITAENRTLANPASVHSLPTCANFEDVVSMGAYAAIKALKSVENAYRVIAIEYLLACQAKDLIPENTTESLTKLHQLLRTKVKVLTEDRFLHPDIEAAIEIVHSHHFLKL